jgi:hypothetical protein
MEDDPSVERQETLREASSGLMSSSAMAGCSTTSSLKRTMSCSRAAMSMLARPRTPPRAV